MSITVTDNFSVTVQKPIDGRLVVADDTARDAIVSGIRYEGMLVYVTADATNYQLVGGILNANWTQLSGAGGGGSGKNYITNGTAEKDTAGWATYKNTAGVIPVDGTGGTSTLSFTVDNSSPLIGKNSFNFTKGASNKQGEGVSYDFTTDREDKCSTATVRFSYEINTGTYVDGDLAIYVVDKTTGQVIQPTAYRVMKATGPTKNQPAEFQLNTGTAYRLCIHVASTSALAYTLMFDSITLSPNTYNIGAVVTDWVAYTPTLTGFGTPTGVEFISRRVGDTLEVMGKFVVGTTTAVEARCTLGFGGVNGNVTSSDTSKIASIKMVGKFGTTQAATTLFSGGVLIEPSVGYFTFGAQASATSEIVKQTGSVGFANGFTIEFFAKTPIQGWGTSQVLSSDTATNVVALQARLTTNTSFTANTPIKYDSITNDTNGAYSASTGLYTCPVPGFYRVSATNFVSSGAGATYVSKNGATTGPFTGAAVATNYFGGSQTVKCNAGDTIGVNTDTTLTYAGSAGQFVSVSIERLSGPAQIAASEKVYLQYTGNAGTALTANVTNIDFATKVVDSHGAWNGTTFTAPRPGWYCIVGSLNNTLAALRDCDIYVNAVQKITAGVAQASTAIYSLQSGIYLNGGDALTFRSDTAAILSNSTRFHWISITSQG
jgi:hypothetical protein